MVIRNEDKFLPALTPSVNTILGIALSFLAAFVPAIVYTLIVWWVDRYEREPGRLMASVFIWGAVPAVLLSILAELILGDPISALRPGLLGNVTTDSLLAPVVEELAKGTALLALFLLLRREFDSVLDGIVYGAVTGFGFAMTENFLYFIDVLDPAAWSRWFSVVVLRSLIFGFNHAFYTAIIGAGFGLAIVVRNGWRWLFVILGLGLAIGFHAVHNLGVSLSASSDLALYIAIVADWGGVLVLGVIVLLALQQERGWIAAELQSEVGYTLTQAQYMAAAAYGRRFSVLFPGARRGSRQAIRRQKQHQRLLTQLAFLKRRLRREGDSQHLRSQITVLRAEILKLRLNA